MRKRKFTPIRAVIIALSLLAAPLLHAQKNVVQPGDPIIASSSNSPGSEGVANAIDGTTAKYLNRDLANDAIPAGFVVTPSIGSTVVNGLAMESANDSPTRDPKAVILEGSNDDSPTWTTGTWTQIYSNDNIPAWSTTFPSGDRFQTQTYYFANNTPYKHYRWKVTHTQGPDGCCMQIGEVQFLGAAAPKNVVQAGDGIIASSSNSPGSEGVANAIDGTTAKYLNRDLANDAIPAGFVVTPSLGATVITGLAMQSANDSPTRDPKAVIVEGSNDDSPTWTTGTWTQIYSNDNITAWSTLFPSGDRFQWQYFYFANNTPYKHYRWKVTHTQGPDGCCMQIGEVQFLGTSGPKNAVQPGDPIIASSSNSPGSEGVANAIDGTTAKYLNRDLANDAVPAGFVVTPSVGATVVTGLAMQSANDSPTRDPKAVIVEGSNDDSPTWTTGTWTQIYSNDNIAAWSALFPSGDRFQWQYFYFNNVVAYKHYRWTVTHTQGPDGCCMQIGEVQFLAVTSSADCSKTAFTLQPVDTAALAGTPATFYAGVNGPWPVQWSVNGKPIPGATSLSYSTPPVTAAIATNTYTVAIVGCQESVPVHAKIFTPSTTTSIGIHFWGNSANGAGPQGNVDPNRPNFLVPNDIVGVQPQAYWNVVTNSAANTGNNGDQSTMADTLTDSSGAASAVTFEFTTSGAWGSGTGVSTPDQILLNGTAGTSASGTDQTVTFHNVPAGNHSVLIYCVSAPLQFTTVKYTIGTQSYYIRVMNSDEWKPAPGFYRGTSTDSKNPSVADFVRFDNVSPDANGDVTLTYAALANTGQGNATGLNGIQLILNAPAVGAPPSITKNPTPVFGPTNGVVQLTVQASGDNLTYQWRKAGKNLPNGGDVSGATTATLTISSLSAADVGVYSVAVFNPAGSLVSQNATVNISSYNIKDALVGHWKLDETSGTTAKNSIAAGQSGTVTDPATWGAGKVGGALAFDGAATYVVVPDYPKATSALSVAGWVNVRTDAATSMALVRNAEGEIGVSVAQDQAPGSQFELILNLDDTTGNFSLHAGIITGPNHTTIDSPTPFPTGSWQQVAFTTDGALLALYINGVQVASTPYVGTFNVPEVKELSMGARLNLDTTDPANPILGLDATPNLLVGQLDDVAIWNRALSADEVKAIYTAGTAGKDVETVVETPPSTKQPGTLNITRASNQITVSWDHGTLQTATAVSGPWTDVSTPSPVTETIGAGAKFYRTISQ
jgi:hypothetical protein